MTQSDEVFGLSPQQLLASRLSAIRRDSALVATIEVRGEIDRARLRGAVESVVARHEILCSRLVTLPESHHRLLRIGVPSDPSRGGEGQPSAPVTIEVTHEGDTSRVLLRLEATHADHQSLIVLLHDLAAAYDGRAAPVELQYVDYSGWVENLLLDPAGDAQRRRWRERTVAATETSSLPFAPGVVDPDDPTSSSVDVALDLELGDVPDVADQAWWLALWRSLLTRLNGSTVPSETWIGVVIAGREEPGLQSLVGPLATTLPTTGAWRAEDSVASAASAEADVLLAAHQDQRSMSWPMDTEGLRLARFGFEYVDDVAPSTSAGGSQFILTNEHGQPHPVAVLLRIERSGARARLRLVADPGELDARFASLLLEQLATLARSSLGGTDRPLLGARVVGDHDGDALRAAEGLRTPPVALRPHETVLAHARTRPDDIAVIDADARLTYAELADAVTDRIRELRRLGVGPEDVVAALLPRGAAAAVGLLATLAVGACWAPVDPDQPRARVDAILETLGVCLVLRGGEATWSGGERRAPVAYDSIPEWYDQVAAALIYTSGSTGNPKGVVLTRRGLINRLAWSDRVSPLRPTDRYLWTSGPGFDFSLYEILAPLLAGATLVCARDLAPEALADLVSAAEIDVMHLTPSLATAVLEVPAFGRAAGLRLLFVGGEACTGSLLARLGARTGAEIRNQYGPTEATIDVTGGVFTPGSALLGAPTDNCAVHVLDDELRPVAVGHVGELCIAGAALARGYRGQPAATAEAFVPDPSGPGGTRLYRTGDLARRRWDGELEFVGRRDRQVSVRGFRVELGEVEAVLQSCHEVVDSAVVPVRLGTTDVQLIAFVQVGDDEVTGDRVRSELATIVPDHLVPAVVNVVPALPLTSHHKIDYRALADLATQEPGTSEWHEPVGPTEEALAAAWLHYLPRPELGASPPVGRHDDFYRRGGHSLVSLRVLTFVKSVFGVELLVGDLLQASTIEALALLVKDHESEPGSSDSAAARWLAVPRFP